MRALERLDAGSVTLLVVRPAQRNRVRVSSSARARWFVVRVARRSCTAAWNATRASATASSLIAERFR